MNNNKSSQQNEIIAQDGCDECLNPNEILRAEFDYARETAAQAMEDRHKMVNYFLIIVGVLLNAVATLMVNGDKIKSDVLSHPVKFVICALLFTLFVMGILYLLKLIRLRAAWHNSALAMNKIKDYYNERMPGLQLIPHAFRWTTESLSSMNMGKCGTLFFYSALLIILFDTLALSGCLIFCEQPIWLITLIFAGSMLFQIALYKTMLSKLK